MLVSDKAVLTYMQLRVDLMDVEQICRAERDRSGFTTYEVQKDQVQMKNKELYVSECDDSCYTDKKILVVFD